MTSQPPPYQPQYWQPPPPPFRDQRKVDADHLKLLAIFHFIGAGLATLGIGFLILHYMVFRTIMSDPMWQNKRQPGPPPGFFEMFTWFYVIIGGWMILSAFLNLFTGIYLRARKHRIFCLVTAAVNCLHMPLGTVLGVFTIIVMLRDSVRTTFEEARGSMPAGS